LEPLADHTLEKNIAVRSNIDRTSGGSFLLTLHWRLNNFAVIRKELISPMTYVVVELCVDCKYTDCAAVCPVEAFHELPDRLYINADTCIDCDACVPECPVEAIFADTNVPENYAHWTQINIDEAPNYPIISQKIPALHGPSCTGPEE
jgi:ferredoxin